MSIQPPAAPAAQPIAPAPSALATDAAKAQAVAAVVEKSFMAKAVAFVGAHEKTTVVIVLVLVIAVALLVLF